MFRRSFESILSDCIEAMRLGATVQQCLDRYPREAPKLAPRLSLVNTISRTPLAHAGANAQEQAWRKLQKRAGELRAGKRPSAVRVSRGYGAWLKPVAVTSAFVAVMSVGAGGVAYASQDAMPDSPLYGVKLAGEDVHVWLTFNDSDKASVLLDQSRQRMEEINETVRQGDPVPQNALSDMNGRNQHAARILTSHLDDTALRARVLSQAQEQEDRLLAVWTQVPVNTRTTYTEAVANLHNTQLDGGAGAAQVSLRPEELSGGILAITGLAEQGEDGLWRIGGFDVRIDQQTLGYKDVQKGSGASILAARSSSGRLHALSANVQANVGPTALVSGAVEEITNKSIKIGGQYFPLSDDTLQTGQVKEGQEVQIALNATADGPSVRSISQYAPASEGADDTAWFEGTIDGDVSKATNQWTVGGLTFQITDNTFIDAKAGSAQDGARVQIEAVSAGGSLQAKRVTVLSSNADGGTAVVLGTFEGYNQDGIWTISGIPVAPPDNLDDPPRGSLVAVTTQRQGPDLTASTVKVIEKPDDPPLIQLEGTISQIDGSRWTLEIGQVRVTSVAGVTGTPDVGKRVIVWGIQGRDGALEATYARILDQAPVVTPAPASSPTPTSTPAPVAP